MKIVFFGDSLTQGTYGVNYVNKVAAQMPGHHFINEGVNGDTSLNLYKRVDADVLKHQPDGVLIMVGVNDAVTHAEPGSRLYYRFSKGIRGGQISPIALRENLRAIITKLRFAQIKVWIVLPPVESRPAVVAALRQMNDYAAELGREYQLPVLDLMEQMTPATIPNRPDIRAIPTMGRNLIRALTLKSSDYDRLREAGRYHYSFDGIHLTDSAAQTIADSITNFLRANGVR
jgi:lysophospholipase L1-like esterase